VIQRIALLLAVLVVVTACQSAPGPSASPSAVVVPATTPPSAPPSVRMPLGGTLRVGLSGPIGSLDPVAADANPLVVGQIFEGLVARGPNGVVPALATKWSVGPDGMTWTFTLRSGVTFHDGTPLDAAAVVTALLSAPRPFLMNVGSGPDPLSLLLVTGAPDGRFLSALATPTFAIASPASPTSGTGPFRVTPALRGPVGAQPVVLERNDRYWRPDASGQKLPYLDSVSFTSIPDAAARLAAIRAGTVDFIQDLAISDVGAIRTDPSLELVPRPHTTVLYLGLNLSQPPLDDPRVRQAIAQSLNPRGLVDRLYGGIADPASQLPPPAMLGFDDSVIEFAKADVAAAKKLLADSGHPSLAIDLWYVLGGTVTVPDMRRVAEAVAADLAAAGINAEPKTIDPVTFADAVRENRYPMWIGLTATTLFDPDEILGAAFIPPAVNGQDQPTAAGGWVNREVAGLLRKAQIEPDQSKRSELYKQVSKIVQREIPRIPLAWSGPPAAATKKVLSPQGALFAEVGLGK
jgi:peptide/nickel transport system substrate-binding protein